MGTLHLLRGPVILRYALSRRTNEDVHETRSKAAICVQKNKCEDRKSGRKRREEERLITEFYICNTLEVCATALDGPVDDETTWKHAVGLQSMRRKWFRSFFSPHSATVQLWTNTPSQRVLKWRPLFKNVDSFFFFVKLICCT